MKGLVRKLWRIAAAAFAVVVILLAVLVGLLRLALVQAPEYRDEVQARASQVLGWPLEISAIDARLGLRGPELRFEDARILSHDRSRTLVRATAGSMQFDALALVRGQLLPGEITLSGVALRLERDRAGRWRLHGEGGPALADGDRSVGETRGDLPQIASLPSGRLRLEATEIEFEDLRRELGPWVFGLNSLELALDGRELSFAATGLLPADLGADVAVSLVVARQDEHGMPTEWTAGVSFSGLDLPAIGAAIGRAAQLPATGILDGSVSAAADGGGLARIAGELAARALQPPRPADEPSETGVPYERIGATFEWTRAAAGWQLRLADLDVVQGARRWTGAAASLVLEEDDVARRIETRVDRLHLQELGPLVPWLSGEARRVLSHLSPAGVLRDVELHLDLPHEAGRTPDVFLAAEFESLSVRAFERWPGIKGMSGRVRGDTYAGAAQLDAVDADVDMPWLFRAPLAVTHASVGLEWRRDADGLHLESRDFRLENADAVIEGRMALGLPGGGASPQLELEGLARGIRLDAGPRYLPVGVMRAKGVVDWLDRALQGGRVDEARFELRGPTRAFPFRGDEGLFKVEFGVAEGELAFDPGWPAATGLAAKVRFENEGLWAEVESGRLRGVAAGPVSVAIPDLAQGQLAIRGRARSSLAALRDFTLATEDLEAILGRGLGPADIRAGRTLVDVDLALPLQTIKDFRARVALQVIDGEVSYGFLGEPLRELNARIDIDNARVTSREASASLAGWPVSAEVSVDDRGSVRVDADGRLDAEALAKILRSPVDVWVTGETEWWGTLWFPAPGADDPLRLEFSSQLLGMAVNLPEPMLKGPAEARSLRVRARFPTPELIDGELEWGEGLRVAARIDRSAPELALLAVPGALQGDPAGLVFSGAVPRLDIGEWLALEWPESVDAGRFDGIVAGGRLLVGEATAPLLRVNDLLVDLRRGEGRWLLALSGDGVEGSVDLPFALYGNDPVRIRLDRLWLGAVEQAGADAVPPRPPGRVAPVRVPPLDIEVEDTRFGPVRLGSVTARVLHEHDGIELIGLEAMGNGFIIQAEGSSRLSEQRDASRLGLRMRTDNVGAALQYMGFRRSMEAREGEFEAEVRWAGGLRSDWLSVLEGTARLAIRDGNITGVEPGAGRVFGLLSFQALPRRLALDFKDVFGEGTRFDRISGDFRFADGNAYTENLLMLGPTADMVVVGRTGLVDRDYDQTAIIAADLGSAFPVAGAVVGGPAVGAALFLLSEVLRKPLQAQVSYRLTGSWENPVIEKLSASSPPRSRAEPVEAAPEESSPGAAEPPEESAAVPPGGVG